MWDGGGEGYEVERERKTSSADEANGEFHHSLLYDNFELACGL